jgi:hypothetical protein
MSTCRQYYSYVTDTQCKRVGTQCWVYGAIMVTEALLCIKNGKELFERTQAINIIIWLLLQLLLSVLCVYGCVLWHRYFQVCWIPSHHHFMAPLSLDQGLRMCIVKPWESVVKSNDHQNFFVMSGETIINRSHYSELDYVDGIYSIIIAWERLSKCTQLFWSSSPPWPL